MIAEHESRFKKPSLSMNDLSEFPASLDLAYKKLEQCASSSNTEAVIELCCQILVRFRGELRARSLLAEFLSTQIESLNKQEWLTVFQKSVREIDYVSAAINGWNCARVIDKHFQADARRVLSILGTAQDECSASVLSTVDSKAPSIDLLLQTENSSELISLLRRIAKGHFRETTSDSFANGAIRTLEPVMAHTFQQSKLNILIIGAGSVGLHLACAIKSTLRDVVEILVIENRVEREHHKLPYNRAWPTFIHRTALGGYLDPRIDQLSSKIAVHGFLGYEINQLETLLLMACKEIGVKFLFSKQTYEDSFAPSLVDIAFDATGGRFGSQSPRVELNRALTDSSYSVQLGPSYNEPLPANYIEGFVQFGLPKQNTPQGVLHQLGYCHNTLVPLSDNGPICVPMFKICNIPYRLYQDLVSLITHINHDNKFYVWPATLSAPINNVLLIISLTEQELSRLMKLPVGGSLLHLRNETIRLGVLVDRLPVVVDFLMKEAWDTDEIWFEKPFVFMPYIQANESRLKQFSGKPLIPIGDSVYNGHPKVGNGLGRHLAFNSDLVDRLLISLNHAISLDDKRL